MKADLQSVYVLWNKFYTLRNSGADMYHFNTCTVWSVGTIRNFNPSQEQEIITLL